MSEEKIWRGEEVIGKLAEIFEQLYLAPGEEGEQEYKKVVLEGEHPSTRSLDHFHTSPNDLCQFISTPAGEIRVITLYEREDFETFLRIIANKCKMVEIPRTQGASFLGGVINRRKITVFKDDYFRKAENGEADASAWPEELKKFLSDRKNFTEPMIILSVGAYSAVPAEKAGYPEEEWIQLSGVIRTYHECTHFMCRRFYPELIDAIWDEVVADAVGVTAALGYYDRRLAEIFLGITEGQYTGGRLENYVDENEENREERIRQLAEKVSGLTAAIAEMPEAKTNDAPFALAVSLEERKKELWDI